jgi:hypothetical protein
MRVLEFIFADDIRQEMGNKTSIMGVYADEIILSPPPPKWPIPFRISAFIRMSMEGTEQVPDKFSLQISQNGNKIAHMAGDLKIIAQVGKFLTLPLTVFPLPIPGPGVIQFDFALSHEGKELLSVSRALNVKTV